MEHQIEELGKELSAVSQEKHQLEEENTKQITALTIENTRLGEQVKMAQAQAHASNNALDTANNERERDHVAHERDRERWEKDRKQEKTLQERLQTKWENEHKARREAETEISTLKTDNARLEEHSSAAVARSAELKEQFDNLQEKFTEVATAQRVRVEQESKPPKPEGP